MSTLTAEACATSCSSAGGMRAVSSRSACRVASACAASFSGTNTICRRARARDRGPARYYNSFFFCGIAGKAGQTKAQPAGDQEEGGRGRERERGGEGRAQGPEGEPKKWMRAQGKKPAHSSVTRSAADPSPPRRRGGARVPRGRAQVRQVAAICAPPNRPRSPRGPRLRPPRKESSAHTHLHPRAVGLRGWAVGVRAQRLNEALNCAKKSDRRTSKEMVEKQACPNNDLVPQILSSAPVPSGECCLIIAAYADLEAVTRASSGPYSSWVGAAKWGGGVGGRVVGL